LVIINLQKTPYDDHCALRIFARVDEVLVRLFDYIKQKIPDYKDLKLTENPIWMKNFTENFPFRSAGSDDWFFGEHRQNYSEQVSE